jgi:hypothetical protein
MSKEQQRELFTKPAGRLGPPSAMLCVAGSVIHTKGHKFGMWECERCGWKLPPLGSLFGINPPDETYENQNPDPRSIITG